MESSTLISNYLNLETKKSDLEIKKNNLILALKNSEYSDRLNLIDLSDRIKLTSDNISKVDSDYAKEISDIKKQNLAKIKKKYVDEYNNLISERDKLLNKFPSDLGIKISELDAQIININKDIAIAKSEIYLSSPSIIERRKKSIENDIKESDKLDPISIEEIYKSTNEIKDISTESKDNSNKILELLSKLDSKLDNINTSSGEGSGIFNKGKKVTKGLAKSILNIGKKVTKGVSKVTTGVKSVADKLNPFKLIKKTKSNVSEKVNSIKQNIKNSVTDIKNKLTPNVLMSKKAKLSKSIEMLGGTEKALLDLRLGVSTANVNIYRLMRGMGFLVSIAGKQDDTSFVSKMRNKYINDTFNPRDIDKGITFYKNDLKRLGGSFSSITKPSSSSNFLARIFEKVKGVFKIAGSAIMGILNLIPFGSIIGPLVAVAGGYFLIKKLAKNELVSELVDKVKENVVEPIKNALSTLWDDYIKPELAKLFFKDSSDPEAALDEKLSQIMNMITHIPKMILTVIRTILINKAVDLIDAAITKAADWAITTLSGLPFGAGAIAAGSAAAIAAIPKGLRIAKTIKTAAKIANIGFGGVDIGMQAFDAINRENDIQDTNYKKPDASISEAEIRRKKKEAKIQEMKEQEEEALKDEKMSNVDKADAVQDTVSARGSESYERGEKLFKLGFKPTVENSEKDIHAYYDYLIRENTHWYGDNDEEIIKLAKERNELLKLKADHDSEKSKKEDGSIEDSSDVDIEKLQSELKDKEKEKKEKEIKYKKIVSLENDLTKLSKELRTHLDKKPKEDSLGYSIHIRMWESDLDKLRNKLKSKLKSYKELTGNDYLVDNSLLDLVNYKLPEAKSKVYTDNHKESKSDQKPNSNNPRAKENRVPLDTKPIESEVQVTQSIEMTPINNAPPEVRLQLSKPNSTELSEVQLEDLVNRYESKKQSNAFTEGEILATKLGNKVSESNKELVDKSTQDLEQTKAEAAASAAASITAAEIGTETYKKVSKFGILFDENNDPHFRSILHM